MILRAILVSLAAAAFAQSVSFTGVSNRFLTPNGDARNDSAEFAFSNPGHVQVSGKIFDLRGGHIADMTADCPDFGGSNTNTLFNGCLRWDGTSSGKVVYGGVYIYVLQAQGWSYSGTIVVIK